MQFSQLLKYYENSLKVTKNLFLNKVKYQYKPDTKILEYRTDDLLSSSAEWTLWNGVNYGLIPNDAKCFEQ